MARLHYRKAHKDYPNAGIAKGDMYYFVRIKTGRRSSRTIRSLTKPRPSQLTVSDFFGRLGDIQELDFPAVEDIDALTQMGETIRELGEDQREKFENMPEGLQQGYTGQMLEERADGCESWADEIESTVGEYENEIEEIGSMDAEALDLDDDADEDEINTARNEKQQEAFERAKDDAESACPF